MEPASDIEKETRKRKRKGKAPRRDPKKQWVLATDSGYVVKGITEWLPRWKNNHYRTSQNTKPANLDLFLQLDTALTTEEVTHDVKIGFWQVARGTI
ncbi:MAG: hypothetical protein Q9226_003189 [Calogaya cf. arnoldii]